MILMGAEAPRITQMKSILAAAMLAAMTTIAYATPPTLHVQTPQHREIGQRDHRLPVRDFDLFERFDLNGDGAITRKEVKLVLEQRQGRDHRAGSAKFDDVSKTSGAAQLDTMQTRHNSLTSQAPARRRTDCLSSRVYK